MLRKRINNISINVECFFEVSSKVFALKLLRLNKYCYVLTPGHQQETLLREIYSEYIS